MNFTGPNLQTFPSTPVVHDHIPVIPTSDPVIIPVIPASRYSPWSALGPCLASALATPIEREQRAGVYFDILVLYFIVCLCLHTFEL